MGDSRKAAAEYEDERYAIFQRNRDKLRSEATVTISFSEMERLLDLASKAPIQATITDTDALERAVEVSRFLNGWRIAMSQRSVAIDAEARKLEAATPGRW